MSQNLRFQLAKKARIALLPLDVLWDVLLRLPAEELCRLRAVCRSWRSLTSDPAFIAAHRAGHPGPLLVGCRLGEGVHVMDLSGNVLKQIRAIGHMVLPTKLDLVCVVDKVSHNAQVINPATGVMHYLPRNMAAESKCHGKSVCNYSASFVFGRATTGEYKVLRVLTDETRPDQIIEVLTLSRSGPTQWRAKQGLPVRVETTPFSSVVVKGVVYIFFKDHRDVEVDCIARFDLRTEKWMQYLRGPLSSHGSNDILAMLPHSDVPIVGFKESLALADLNDFLIVSQYKYQAYAMQSEDFFLDLWFLIDLENCQWERKYRIDLKMAIRENLRFCTLAYPSSILDDGRLLLRLFMNVKASLEGRYSKQVLGIYDPKTNALSSDILDVTEFTYFGHFAGSLLSV